MNSPHGVAITPAPTRKARGERLGAGHGTVANKDEHERLGLERDFLFVQFRKDLAVLADPDDASVVAALNRRMSEAVPAVTVPDAVQRFRVGRMRERKPTMRAEDVHPALVHPRPEKRLDSLLRLHQPLPSEVKRVGRPRVVTAGASSAIFAPRSFNIGHVRSDA